MCAKNKGYIMGSSEDRWRLSMAGESEAKEFGCHSPWGTGVGDASQERIDANDLCILSGRQGAYDPLQKGHRTSVIDA